MAQQFYEPSNQELQNQIAISTNELTKGMYSLQRHIDHKFAPIRRKKTNHILTRNQTGELMLAQCYDDQSCECFYIFNQFLGVFTIYKMKPQDYAYENDLFLIHFSHSDIWIVGEVDKLSEKYFYNLFLQQHIPFNQSLPRAKIERVLFEFFNGLISSCENITTVPALAGWLNQRFRHCENTIKSSSLRGLPIAKKTFEILPLKDSTFYLFKNFLQQFSNDNTRLMVALYPFVSILASVFKEFRGNINFTLNIVPTSTLNIKDVAEYFQIFSRDTLCTFHSSDSQKSIEKILQQTKDEVLLMDMRLPADSDYYRRKQRYERFDFVYSVLSGRTNITKQIGTAATAGLVTICDEIILKQNVFNITTDSEFDALSVYGDHTVNLFKENKVMARIYTQFVQFIEQKDDFFEVFTRTTTAQTHTGSILEITYFLLSDFWKAHNIDMVMELGVPEKIDFDNILFPEVDSDDEDIEIFLETLTENMLDYPIIQKRFLNDHDVCIFYDNTYVYFPSDIMESICNKCQMHHYRQFLIKLRAKNMLSAAQDRLTKHVVVNKKPIGCYVLRRSLFKKIGELEFTLSGKEND